jgi:hypothetical protein
VNRTFFDIVAESGISFTAVEKSNFPLPSLGPVLHKLSIDLHHGSGFFVLRGLQSSKYSREDNIFIYLGVSSYVGSRRGRINPRGEMICKSSLAFKMTCKITHLQPT